MLERARLHQQYAYRWALGARLGYGLQVDWANVATETSSGGDLFLFATTVTPGSRDYDLLYRNNTALGQMALDFPVPEI